MVATYSTAYPHVKTGRLKALGQTGAKRAALLPELPTLAESGVAEYEFSSAFGILAPSGTSKTVVDRLNRAIAAMAKLPELRERLAVFGEEPYFETPAQFMMYLRAELQKYSELAKKSNVSTDRARHVAEVSLGPEMLTLWNETMWYLDSHFVGDGGANRSWH
jgi:tripartite-type tricarboxylate transporter receptor subunit TctC